MDPTLIGSDPLRVVVATIVHHPDDARIRHRQIEALLDAGAEVTYIAPVGDGPAEGLTRVEIPRASGRRRLHALRAARAALRAHTPRVDVTIVHDPELVLAAGAITGPRVWDIHEDVVAQLTDKTYIPSSLRPVARLAARSIERYGAAHFECLIAERGYVERYPGATLVPNTVRLPEVVAASEGGRVVYLGRVSHSRGADLLATVRSALEGLVEVDVIGPVDADVQDLLSGRGFIPNDVALPMLGGATAGLSLLRDLPNYRHSMPTKILEYMAWGVPVITTPLPEAAAIVEAHDCGIVVPHDDPAAVVEAIRTLDADADERQRLADNGRTAARLHYNWATDSTAFVEALRNARTRRQPRNVIPR